MSNQFRYYRDSVKTHDMHKISYDKHNYSTIGSSISVYNDDTGELIFEDLHNRTVIAGSALLAQKVCGLDPSFLNNTPSYNSVLGVDNDAPVGSFPSVEIVDTNGNVIGTYRDESQRKIIGFMLGNGGCGSDQSDVFDVHYASWIEPDNIVPFRYCLSNEDNIDENIYKLKKTIVLPNGQERVAYYGKTFSNTPIGSQHYTTSTSTYSDSITPSTVYTNKKDNENCATTVEYHLKVTKEDAREYFVAHEGLPHAGFNQISLLWGWEREIDVTKQNSSGNVRTQTVTQFCDTKVFSLLNVSNEALSDLDKSLSIVYTLYF